MNIFPTGDGVLRSKDGTQVINAMHWDSEAALRTATRSDPRIVRTMRKVTALVEGRGPAVYEVAAVLK